MFAKAPWAYTETIYIGTDTLGMWGDGTDPYADMPAIHSLSSDGLAFDVDIMLRWSLDVNKVRYLYIAYPQKNWKFEVIGSAIREAVRNTVSDFTAIDIIENRTVVAQRILAVVQHTMQEKTASLLNALINVETEFRDIIPPPSFLAAIEAKLNAEQSMLQAEYEKERMIELAEGEKATTILLAEAEAQKLIVEASGTAEARVVIANSTKQAIQLIVESAGGYNATEIAELYLTLEALKEMALTSNRILFFITTGTDGMPLIIPIQPE